MTDRCVVAVTMYGRFAEDAGTRIVHVDVTYPCTVATLKAALSQRLGTNSDGVSLLSQSVIADTTQILSEHDIIDGSCTLALLPPVCGG